MAVLGDSRDSVARIVGSADLAGRQQPPPTIPYTEFISQVEAGNVKEIYAQGDTIQGELTNEAKLPDDR